MKKLNAPEMDAIVRGYTDGETPSEIAESVGRCVETVRRVLRRRRIPRRSRSEVGRRFPLDETAFSVITPESAYWIGFLMADGNISGNSVQIGLSDKDSTHLEKFLTFIKSGGHRITRHLARDGACGDKVHKAASLGIRSAKLVSDLAKFGVVPRKSLIAKVTGGLEMNRDFWRGVVDGDGSLMRLDEGGHSDPNGHPVLSLVGNQKLLRQFHLFVLSVAPGCRAAVRPLRGVSIFKISNSVAVAAISALYKDALISLDRKSAIAVDILSTY